MASSSKKVTIDLDQVLHLNDVLFADFTPAKMLQGDNISQLSAVITNMLCKPQMYMKKLMVNTLNCLLSSWEEDVAVCDLLEGCLPFLSTADAGPATLPVLPCDDSENFCLFATALLNLCKDDRQKMEVGNNVVKRILNFKDSEDKLLMVRRMWSEKDALGLSIETVEELVLRQPLLVEELLVDVGLTVASAAVEDCEDMLKVALAEPGIASLLGVSVRSSLVFQTVTSILHSLVCRTPLNVNLLRLSQEVFATVSQSRGARGVVPLLPPRQQALALCLQIDPDLLPDGLGDSQRLYVFTVDGAAETLSKSCVLRMIAAGLVADPAGTSALLVYYPQWMKQLSRQVMLM